MQGTDVVEVLAGDQRDIVTRNQCPSRAKAIVGLCQIQKFVAQMLDALIAQATTKARSKGREVLQ